MNERGHKDMIALFIPGGGLAISVGDSKGDKEASDSTHSKQWAKLGSIFMIILGRGPRELLSILENLHEKRFINNREIFKVADGDFNGRLKGGSDISKFSFVSVGLSRLGLLKSCDQLPSD